MAYYVRKIARAKWALLEHGAENVIENYKADTIANDMKTQGNTWIQNGEINIDQLKDRQKEALLKWREKKNKAS